MQELTREVSAAYNNSTNNNSYNNNNNSHNYKVEMSPHTALLTSAKSNHLDPHLASLTANIKLEEAHAGELLPVWQPEVPPLPRLGQNSTNSKLLLQGSDDPLISHGASSDAHDEDHPFKTLLARKSQEQRSGATSNGACSTLTKQQLKAKASLMKSHKQSPPLDLEQSLQSSRQQSIKTKKRSNAGGSGGGVGGALKLRFHHQALPASYLSHYEATQGRQPVVTAKPSAPPAAPRQAHENVRSWLRKIAEIQRSAERQQQAGGGSGGRQPPPPQATQTPAPTPAPVAPPAAPASKRSVLKFADLPYMGEITLDNYKPRRGRKPKKADICHLIYKNYGTIVPPTTATTPTTTPELQQRVVQRAGAGTGAGLEEQPLNLCLRDQSSDRYSISSGDSDKLNTTQSSPAPHLRAAEELPAKLLPVGLYYQQLMESCAFGAMPVETIEKDNQLALKIPIPNGFFAPLEPIRPATPATAVTAATPTPTPTATATATPTAASLALRKRKRSAIFIPPMPAEHSSSPSTEVSICKFKFTGGAKPTLQEKKMLSVDAEGNYRYYNGTGDKTLRGYEFISREQQQQLLLQQPANDKLYIDIPPPSTDLSLELLHIPPESPTSALLMSSGNLPPQSPSSHYSSSQSPMPSHSHSVELPLPAAGKAQSEDNERKRRSSRRSKQREKLEKTFKEKGFLIQTQQLQSAEGATYCKFRQLKKFTRYLFRNWKDHIPASDLAKHQIAGEETSAIENLLAGQLSLDSSIPMAAAADHGT